MEILRPSTIIKIKNGSKEILGRILAVLVEENKISYKVSILNEGSRKVEWIEEFEISSYQPDQKYNTFTKYKEQPKYGIERIGFKN